MDINIYKNGWNEINAYIFGWIMSDGCLKKEGRNKTSYAIRICSNDFDIIKWLHGHMCSGNKIYSQGKGYQIKYRNKESIEFCMHNCLVERKSLIMQFPNVPDDYIFHFIRGYFDGDGSIILRKTIYNTYAQVSFTCGSKSFLEKLKEKLQEYNIRSQIYEDGRNSNSSCCLRVTKRNDIRMLFSLLYPNDFQRYGYLKRKYIKYLEYMKYDAKCKSHIV